MEIEIQIEHTRIPASHSRIFGTFAMCIHIFYTGLCVACAPRMIYVYFQVGKHIS